MALENLSTSIDFERRCYFERQCYTVSVVYFKPLGRILIVLLLLLGCPLQAQDPIDTLIASLSTAQGPERLGLLQELTEELLRRSQYQQALLHALEAEGLARQVGNREAQASALVSIGFCSLKLGESQRAVVNLNRGIEIFEGLGETEKTAFARTSRCIGLRNLGKYPEALEDCFRSHDIYQDLGDRDGLTQALNNIGRIYRRLQQPEEALRFFEKALALQDVEGNKILISRLLNNIAITHQQEGRYHLSLSYLQRSLKLKEEIGDVLGATRRLSNLASVYSDLGDLETAQAYYEKALEISLREEFKRPASQALGGLANLAIAKGDQKQAIELLEELLKLQRASGDRDILRYTYRDLAFLYRDLGQFQKAFEAFLEYEQLEYEILNQEKEQVLAEMQTRFETTQKEKEIERLKHEQQLGVLAHQRQRNIWGALLVGAILIFSIVLLLVNRSRLKTRDAMARESLRREQEVSTRLREVDKLKDEFLANTSHELRTPLYGMTGLTESLIDGAKGELPEAVKRDLALIASSGHRLSHLVSDILDFSKIRHHNLKIRTEPVELHSLADVALTLTRPLVGEKTLELENAVSPQLPPAEADPNRIQQVLHNLIGNAIKFTDQGRVVVSAEVQKDQLIVSVADTGIGIAEDQLDRIFQSFEQADATTARMYGGTGLGLSISRRLVELQGGRLWVVSSLGEGAVFSFSLPLSENTAIGTSTVSSHVPAFVGEIPQSTGLAVELQEFLTGEARVLVVDDEPMIREVLANHLIPEGYVVLQSPGGEEALELLGREEVDLVLLDIMMPRISGYEVCRVIRKTRSLEELPVLFLTAKSQPGDPSVGFSEGANDYLNKPIAKSELLARVETHLRLLTTHREQKEQVKVLRGLLRICSQCSRICDEEGQWTQLEHYIDTHSEAEFSHGLCEPCAAELYGDLILKPS